MVEGVVAGRCRAKTCAGNGPKRCRSCRTDALDVTALLVKVERDRPVLGDVAEMAVSIEPPFSPGNKRRHVLSTAHRLRGSLSPPAGGEQLKGQPAGDEAANPVVYLEPEDEKWP